MINKCVFKRRTMMEYYKLKGVMYGEGHPSIKPFHVYTSLKYVSIAKKICQKTTWHYVFKERQVFDEVWTYYMLRLLSFQKKKKTYV